MIRFLPCVQHVGDGGGGGGGGELMVTGEMDENRALHLFDGYANASPCCLTMRVSFPEAMDVNNLCLLLPEGLLSVNLSRNGISGLARPFPTTLIRLDLSSNRMAQTGITRLAQQFAERRHVALRELNLAYNSINSKACVSLCRALRFTSISDLNLRWNDIGDEGAIALAGCLPQSSITCLQLCNCGIGNAGVRAINSALLSPQHTQVLRELDLRANAFDIECLTALGKMESLLLPSDALRDGEEHTEVFLTKHLRASPVLRKLDLSSNRLLGTDSVLLLLHGVFAHRALEQVDLDGTNISLRDRARIRLQIEFQCSSKTRVLVIMRAGMMDARCALQGFPVELLRMLKEML